MGLFDWLRGKPEPSLDVTFNPPAGSKPFGVDKPISECSDEDIQASREALWKAGADVIKGWRYEAGCDHSSTLFELAVDGMEAATREALPPVPEGQKLRSSDSVRVKSILGWAGPETALEPPREERKRAIPVKTKERKRRI